jgi:hypothetical protein
VVTPAGFAFSIWALIYAGILAFAIFRLLRPATDSRKGIGTLFILSCVLNCGWVFFWHREMIGICLALILFLLAVLLSINSRLRSSSNGMEFLAAKAPLGLYAGWVMAASSVNAAVFLKYLKIDLSDVQWNIIGVTLIAVVVAAGVLVRFRIRSYLVPAAVAWALVGIAVKQSGNTAVVVACAIGVIVSLVAAISFIMDLSPAAGTASPSAHE